MIRVIFSRGFLPFWVALGILAIGHSMRWLPGVAVILFAQIFWIFARTRVKHFLDHGKFENRLYGPLLWLKRALDALMMVAIYPALNTLKEAGEIVENGLLLTYAATAAVALTAVIVKRTRTSMSVEFAIWGVGYFLWFTLAFATLNIWLDHFAPVSVESITYRQCLDQREAIMAGNLPAADRADCQPFGFEKSWMLNTQLVTTLHRGALGIRWKTWEIKEQPN